MEVVVKKVLAVVACILILVAIVWGGAEVHLSASVDFRFFGVGNSIRR